ncbi:hypothetical protein [Mycobacterium sp.]|uniref:hypothetical protein n=1 Tax=Mycobacterium sp. TaxID=1785 RepID=UPI0025FF8A75|nr:hypothetical protein [Mycobacterium sp.]
MTAVLETSASVGPDGDVVASAPVVNTMGAAALFTALSDALLFTAPASAQLPMLDAVRLEFGGGQLVAAATDRFVLGVSRVDYTGRPLTVLVSGGEAKALAKMAKTVKRDEKSREVTIEDGAVDEPRKFAVTFRFSTGEAMTVRGMDVEFPTWRRLLPADASRMGGLIGMGYNPAHLARFAKARSAEQGAGAQMVVFPTSGERGKPGPTVIRIGENFIGLLMPIRPTGDKWEYGRPGWLDPAAVAGAADVAA